MQGNRVPVLWKLPAYELNVAIECQSSYRFLQPAASCIIQAKIYFLQIWLTFLFAFISLKHNKLQMIQWGYHNCYGNLELRADFWLKTKNGFIDNTATDEEKKTSNDWV